MKKFKKTAPQNQTMCNIEMQDGLPTVSHVVNDDRARSAFMRKEILKLGSIIHRRRLQNGWTRKHVSKLSGEVVDHNDVPLIDEPMTPAKIEAIEEYGFSCDICELMVLLDLMGVTDEEINRAKET